jgi:PAS domain S-box-containing protein
MNPASNFVRSRAMDFSSQGIVITDPNQPDNPIVDVNPAFEVLTGYLRSELVGKNCRFLQGETTDPAAVKKLQRAIKARRHVLVELANYRKDGSIFWNELTVSPVYDDDGNLINFIGIQQDITERWVAAIELSKRNIELESYAVALSAKDRQQKTIDKRIQDLLMQAGIRR